MVDERTEGKITPHARSWEKSHEDDDVLEFTVLREYSARTYIKFVLYLG